MGFKELIEKARRENKRKAAADNAKKYAVGAGIGAAFGAIAGLLFAPKSGKETRKDIADGAKKAVDITKKTVGEAKEKLEEKIEEFTSKEKSCCASTEETSDEKAE